jgi:flagellar hook-associated protein 2
LGLTAQVVNTGSATDPYKLVISSATGKAQGFDISSNATAGQALGFTSLSSAADAEFVVNGVAMSRSTNTVSDAITGVTLNLKSTTPGGVSPTPVTLDIGIDTSSFKTKMTELVASYNDTANLLKEVSDPKSTLETYGATLVGDSIVRSVKQQLRTMFQGNSSTPGTTISAFWQMGIKVDETGVMSFDSATFQTAVQGNYSDVVKSLTGNFDNLSTYSTAPAGFVGDAVRKLTNLMASGGPILSASENASTQNTKYQDDLSRLQTRMDKLLTRYQKQLAAMDSLVGNTNTQKTSLKSTFEGMMSVYTNN